MPGFYLDVRRNAACYKVVDPRRIGPVIGYIADSPIAETVVDRFGRAFLYVGAAPRRRHGAYDVESLQPGDFIVEPGLLYRLNGVRAKPSTAHATNPTKSSRLFGEGRKAACEMAIALALWLTCVLAAQLLVIAAGS
jgi:hypothetical protein